MFLTQFMRRPPLPYPLSAAVDWICVRLYHRPAVEFQHFVFQDDGGAPSGHLCIRELAVQGGTDLRLHWRLCRLQRAAGPWSCRMLAKWGVSARGGW